MSLNGNKLEGPLRGHHPQHLVNTSFPVGEVSVSECNSVIFHFIKFVCITFFYFSIFSNAVSIVLQDGPRTTRHGHTGLNCDRDWFSSTET